MKVFRSRIGGGLCISIPRSSREIALSSIVDSTSLVSSPLRVRC